MPPNQRPENDTGKLTAAIDELTELLNEEQDVIKARIRQHSLGAPPSASNPEDAFVLRTCGIISGLGGSVNAQLGRYLAFHENAGFPELALPRSLPYAKDESLSLTRWHIPPRQQCARSHAVEGTDPRFRESANGMAGTVALVSSLAGNLTITDSVALLLSS